MRVDGDEPAQSGHSFTLRGHAYAGDTLDINSTTAEEMRQFHQLGPGSSLDESRLGLVDTACTMCMHSRAWRIAFSRHLPAGRMCRPTARKKKFNFADGGHSEFCEVWIIPIGILYNDGEVHSTEIPTGSTPLLLSIPALDALDGHVHVRRMVLELSGPRHKQ